MLSKTTFVLITAFAAYRVSYATLCTTTQATQPPTVPATAPPPPPPTAPPTTTAAATTLGPIPNSNPNGNPAITPYHPCFRPMISYLQLTYGGESRCEGGPTNNKCRNGECLDPYLPVCCQNEKGCNACSVPCDHFPDPPTGCTSGYSAYNKPDSCYVYVCNEDLADVQAADQARVAAAYFDWKGVPLSN